MAGKAVGRFEAAIGVIGILALATTLIITTGVNPLVSIMDWLDRVTSVSSPAPAWNQRMAGRPSHAGITNSAQVIVTSRGRVEGRYVSDGGVIWQHDAPWATAAGDVVVAGLGGRGYGVFDPATGLQLWEDKNAGAVWPYEDILLDLACPNDRSCLLRARSHRNNGATLWTAELPGNGRTITGLNPDLLDTRDPAGWVSKAAAASPGPAPSVIALLIDGRVQVVDLVEGRVLREIDPHGLLTRVSVAGGRVIITKASRGESACRYVVEAFDVQTGASVWRQEGYDLDTASGIGCEQRRDPLGRGGLLSAVRGDNHPVLLDAADGSERWVGQLGERVLATDGALAVIEGADRQTARLIDLLDGNTVAWSLKLGENPDAAVTSRAVLVRDSTNDRLVVLSRSGVLLRDLKTDSELIGYGRIGIVLASGRTVGLVTLPPSP
jgi:hypothetical protein